MNRDTKKSLAQYIKSRNEGRMVFPPGSMPEGTPINQMAQAILSTIMGVMMVRVLEELINLVPEENSEVLKDGC
jgi:hypothetical protein